MAKKRDRLEIIFEILDALSKEPLNPTKLATLVNMPYDRLKKLLEELIEKGMVQCEEQGKAKIFRLTSQGFKIHEELKKVRKILQDYGILK